MPLWIAERFSIPAALNALDAIPPDPSHGSLGEDISQSLIASLTIDAIQNGPAKTWRGHCKGRVQISSSDGQRKAAVDLVTDQGVLIKIVLLPSLFPGDVCNHLKAKGQFALAAFQLDLAVDSGMKNPPFSFLGIQLNSPTPQSALFYPTGRQISDGRKEYLSRIDHYLNTPSMNVI